MKPGMYEARSLLNGSTALVVLDGTDRAATVRLRVALAMIRDAPRARDVRETAVWGLGDMGED